MPTLEPQPLRTRSSSFRHNRDGSTSPSGSRCSSPSPLIASSQQGLTSPGSSSDHKGRSFSVGTGGLSPRGRDRSPSPLLLPDSKQRSCSLSPRQLASGRLHLEEGRSPTGGGSDGEFAEEDTQPIPMGPVTLSVTPTSPVEKQSKERVEDQNLPNGNTTATTDGVVAPQVDNIIDDNNSAIKQNSANDSNNKADASAEDTRTEKTPVRKRNSVTYSDKAIVIEDSGIRVVQLEVDVDGDKV